jgi:hypothetical protein
MMRLAGPSEVLFGVWSFHQSGTTSCPSRMVVRRIHCNEWVGWAEQDRTGLTARSVRELCPFFLVFPHTVVTFLFLLSRSPPVSPLVAQRLVPRTTRIWKGRGLGCSLHRKIRVSFGGLGWLLRTGWMFFALKAQRWRLLWISLGSRVSSFFCFF